MRLSKITSYLAALLLCGASPRHSAVPPLRLVGVTSPSKVVALSAASAGILASIAVREGETVKRGAPVFQLSSELLELEVERLRVSVGARTELRTAAVRRAEAIAEKQRVEELHRQKIATAIELQAGQRQLELAEIQLDAAKATQRSLEIQLREAQARLAQRLVESPIEGYVSKRLREVGEAVEELSPVVEIVQRFPMWVEFSCPLDQADRLTKGTKVALRACQDPKRTAMARVVFASAVADAASQTFRVRVEIQGPVAWKTGLKVFADLGTH